MKLRNLVIVLPLTLAIPTVALTQEHSDHSAHKAHNLGKTTKKTTTKYKADEVLNENMSRIQKESGNPTQILKIVDEIFQTCKLAPDADEALHGALIPIIAGAKALQHNSQDRKAKDQIQMGLKEYRVRFE